jgi:penicillin-binding protein 2
MANGMAAIANSGYWITPHVIRSVEGSDSMLKKTIVKHVVPVDSSYFRMVREGLERVVEAGTATVAQIPGLKVAGKTGTAENPHGDDHSIFVAYAPVEDPRIAIAVVVENSGFGSRYAAPIASLMIEKYLNDTISTPRKFLEERMMTSTLIK